MTKQRLFLTGASGFLGFNLLAHLREHFEIYTLENRTFVQISENRKIKINLENLSKSKDDLRSFLKSHDIRVIVHAAAMAQPDECEKEPEIAKKINIDATQIISDISTELRCHFFFTSTDLIYGRGHGPHDESDANPDLLYSNLKFDAEKYIISNNPFCVVFRCALMYGADDGHSAGMFKRMKSRIENGENLTLFTDQYRTPLWAPDVATAIVKAVQLNINGEIFNLGGSERINRYDFGMRMARMFNWNTSQIKAIKMSDLPHLAKRGNDCSMNSQKAHDQLNWKPTTIDQSLKNLKILETQE